MFPGKIYLCSCEQRISSCVLSWNKSAVSDIKIKLTALDLFATALTTLVDEKKASFSAVVVVRAPWKSLIFSLPLPW